MEAITKEDAICLAHQVDNFAGLWNERRHITDLHEFLCRFANLVAAYKTATEIDDAYERGRCDGAAADELRRLYAVNQELLEALKTCVCAMQDYQAGIGITEMFDAGERMGRAAIAKAEGKT